ncbi:MAG: hypothetical protein QOG91_667 [Candidatus Parcubacteria bacterium]|nr:hypothetical protein [Candidatus Parcubacteria bacterium]
MKNMIRTMTLACVLAGSADAQDLPMIRSRDALRTFALEQAARVNAGVSTRLPTSSTPFGFVPVASPTAAGIVDTIRGLPLSVDIANLKDEIYSWANTFNADNDPLFTGFHEFNLVAGRDGYTLPEGYGAVTLTLYDVIPIRVDGAEAATIAFRNLDGTTRDEYALQVRNGKVYFPRQLTGTNAVLAIQFSGPQQPDGSATDTWKYWDVTNGTFIPTKHFELPQTATIQGIQTFTDTDVYVQVPTTNSIGFNITAELKSTNPMAQRRSVSAWTTEGKWFTGAYVRKAGQSFWKYYPAFVDPTRGLVLINLFADKGILYVIPVWNNGDLIEPPDPWFPPYYGGKGEAVAN